MFYAGAVLILVFVLCVFSLTLMLCRADVRPTGYVVVPVTGRDDDDLALRIKALCYEETFYGGPSAREVIVVDYRVNDDAPSLSSLITDTKVSVIVLRPEELSDYIFKKECLNEKEI